MATDVERKMTEQDDKADAIVAGMVSSALAFSLLPGVNTVPFIGAMGAGVVSIGAVYGFRLSKDEGWKLVREFLKAGGFATAAAFGGGKVLAVLAATTGIGYGGAVAIDAAVGTATAFAVGMAAKHYFRTDRNMAEARDAFRRAYTEKRRA